MGTGSLLRVWCQEAQPVPSGQELEPHTQHIPCGALGPSLPNQNFHVTVYKEGGRITGGVSGPACNDPSCQARECSVLPPSEQPHAGAWLISQSQETPDTAGTAASKAGQMCQNPYLA